MTTSPTLDAFISDEAAIKEMLLRRTGRHARRIVAIIPAYQEAKVIANTIASLQAQTIIPTLILVAANNCTDGTEQVAHEAGATVYLVENNRDKKAGALNRTLEMLDSALDDTDMVLIADADTQLTPDFIEVALQYHRDYTFVGGVGGAFEGRPTTTLIGTLQQMEYYRYLGQIKRFGSEAFVLSGTGCLFLMEALRAVKHARREGVLLPKGESFYDTLSLTEDNEMTLALKVLRYRCMSPEDMRTTTDVMDSVKTLHDQRDRWYLGALWNLRHYGTKMPWRMRATYWRQQAGLLLSTFGMALFLILTIVMFGILHEFTFSWFYLGLTALVTIERLASVWKMGRKARLLVLFGADQLYSMLLTSFFAIALVKCVRGNKGDWIPA